VITIFSDHSKTLYMDTNLQKNEEVKDMVHMRLSMQPKTFFTDSIRKLVD
jgi:hypothetical protein